YLVQHQITAHQVELHELLARLLPTTVGGTTERAFEQVESALASLVRQRVRLTAVGLPLFLWFSTRLFGGLRAALNEVFDTDERRPWPVAKLLDLVMVLCTGALLVLGALVATWEARNAGSVSRSFLLDWLWRFSLETTSFALGVALFFVIFKLLPSRRIHWRTALVAATRSRGRRPRCAAPSPRRKSATTSWTMTPPHGGSSSEWPSCSARTMPCSSRQVPRRIRPEWDCWPGPAPSCYSRPTPISCT